MADALCRRCARAIGGGALVLALAALPPAAALARTPTPSMTPTITDGPSPTVTGPPTATPTGTMPIPRLQGKALPDPARSGQRVTLDGSGNSPFSTYQWTQVGGDVALRIENADQPVASFVAPEVSQMTVVSVQLAVTGYNDGPLVLAVTLLPADWVLCGVAPEGSGAGAPGDVLPMAVVLRPYGIGVTGLEHEMGFGRFAPVVDRGDGVPDCEAGPDLSVLSAQFAFVPRGCAQSGSCTGVHASLTTRYAIPDYAIAYRCMVALAEEESPPEEGCYHTLTCIGGSGTSGGGQALTVNCPEGSDGHVSVDYALRPLGFDIRAVPAAPNVGDTVQVIVSAHGVGGLGHYDLHGVEPILHGTTSADASGPLGGDVSFELHADCPGTAFLNFSVYYETLAGCPGNTFFRFTSQTSPVVPLIVREPGSFRVTGRVADQPSGCSGGTQVAVRLEPLGWSVTSGADGGFAFDGVPPGDYTLSIGSGCGRFQCWSETAVHVDAQDVDATLCPQRLAGDACIGDCDLNQTVTVDELLVGVGMVLGERAFEACPPLDVDGDGAIAVHELIAAVARALDGCGS